MKIVLVAAIMFGLISPVVAQDDEELKGPSLALASMIGCAANELNLKHLDIQAAAAISTLVGSKATPQITMLINSYKALADDDSKRVASYVGLINDVIIPQIVASSDMQEDVVRKASEEVLGKIVLRIAMKIHNPENTFDDQVKNEQSLRDLSKQCETLAGKMQKGI